jgi:hypothetical protein
LPARPGTKAFLSKVDAGSREENAPKQNLELAGLGLGRSAEQIGDPAAGRMLGAEGEDRKRDRHADEGPERAAKATRRTTRIAGKKVFP